MADEARKQYLLRKGMGTYSQMLEANQATSMGNLEGKNVQYLQDTPTNPLTGGEEFMQEPYQEALDQRIQNAKRQRLLQEGVAPAEIDNLFKE